MTATYDEDKAFERVMRACRAAEAKGWKIEKGGFLSLADKTCCPIGAFCVARGYRRNLSHEGNLEDAVWLFCSETGLRERECHFFFPVIDGALGLPERASVLARRVRAALWGEG